ncbi:MAG TPA: serine hydrolase domain-containing protein [Thermodesulfobacteriota bacterium]|nr:serine hydrolase domain-containing protein [Thermodesulfobacteriota bacterium]
MRNFELLPAITVFCVMFLIPHARGWSYDWTEVDELMEDITQAARLEGAALLIADEFNDATKEPVLMYENYQNGYSRNTERPVCSATKWLTATLVMKILGPDLDQALVSDWFDDGWDTPYKNQISIIQCLYHASGLPGDDSLLDDCTINLHDAAAHLGNAPLESEPGTVFCYGGASYQVAGGVVEQWVQKTNGPNYRFCQLFRDLIEIPLDIEIPGQNEGMGWVCTYDGEKQNQPENPRIGGGLVTTPFDYMKFLAAFLADSTRTTGTPILLPRDLIDLMRTPRVNDSMRCSDLGIDADYGIGGWLPHYAIADNFGYVMSSDGARGTIPWISWELDPPYAALFFTDNLIQNVQNRVWHNLVPAVYTAYDCYTVMVMSGFDSDETWPGVWRTNRESPESQGTTTLTPCLGDRCCYLKGALLPAIQGYVMKTLSTINSSRVILRYTVKTAESSTIHVRYSTYANPDVSEDSDWVELGAHQDADWSMHWYEIPAGQRNVAILFRCSGTSPGAYGYVDHVVVVAR